MVSEENAKEVKMQQRLSPIYPYIFFIRKAKKNPCMTNLLGDQDSWCQNIYYIPGSCQDRQAEWSQDEDFEASKDPIVLQMDHKVA